MLSSLNHPETGSSSGYRFYLKPSADLFGLCSVTILNFPLSLMEALPKDLLAAGHDAKNLRCKINNPEGFSTFPT